MVRILQILAVILGLMSIAPSARAAELSIDDLVGKWCGSISDYTITRTEMFVHRHDNANLTHGANLHIVEVEKDGDSLILHWSDTPGDATRFSLSDDRRELIQGAETSGDKGPRRVFRHCS